jgi:hypothetical protein
MRAVEIMLESGMSLRRMLRYAGCSTRMYYYEPIERTVELDPTIVDKMKEIALPRPSYGTGGWPRCCRESSTSP